MCKKKILVHCQIKRSKRSYTLHFISGELAKDYAERHNVPKWYDDANLLINSPDVDAVYIATPPGSHKEYTIKAAKAGKSVYVEKPMVRNIAECQEMIAACEAVGIPLYRQGYGTVHHRAFRSLYGSCVNIGDIDNQIINHSF